jgi:hypothetical protein
MKRLIAVFLSLSLALSGAAPIVPARNVTPPDPPFNRLHPNKAIEGFLHGYAKAYPDWVKLESIGKGGGGGDIWLVTITNPKTGAASSKPAIYIDGATHGNEIQGTEVCLYIIHFVLNNYGRLPRITELLDRGTLYLAPMVNVDARARWFTEPSTPHYPRTLIAHIDDDRDGKTDEDGYEDLDGDGEITMMRKKVPPGQGRFKLDPKDPRLVVPAGADELGDYIMLGAEGLDNDGDGAVNEDPLGYVDPNRTWGYGFQPRYVQAGAPDYPLQYPETRSIAEWAARQDNIIAVQSFHNTGGIILRGPGARGARPYAPDDGRVHDLIGKEGEKMLPGYRYGVIHQILYSAYGGTTDHFYGRHGAIAFSNELHTDKRLFGAGNTTPADLQKFNDLLTHGRQFADWKPFKHPQYGEIEIGGFKHDTGRLPEGFLLEEECHRNASFVLFHAHHMPKLSIQEPAAVKVKDNLWRLHVPVLNERAIPSMLAIARQLKLHRPDIATVEGAKVISSGIVQDQYLNRVSVQRHRPERLEVNGVPGFGTTTLFFLVEGQGEVTVTYDSLKAGKVSRKIALQ